MHTYLRIYSKGVGTGRTGRVPPILNTGEGAQPPRQSAGNVVASFCYTLLLCVLNNTISLKCGAWMILAMKSEWKETWYEISVLMTPQGSYSTVNLYLDSLCARGLGNGGSVLTQPVITNSSVLVVFQALPFQEECKNKVMSLNEKTTALVQC